MKQLWGVIIDHTTPPEEYFFMASKDIWSLKYEECFDTKQGYTTIPLFVTNRFGQAKDPSPLRLCRQGEKIQQ